MRRLLLLVLLLIPAVSTLPGGTARAADGPRTSWTGGEAHVNDPALTFGGLPRGHREPVVAINPANPAVMLAVTIDQNPQNQVPEVEGYGGWTHIYRSADGGRTWRDIRMLDWPRLPGNRNSGDPGVVFGDDGTAYLVSLSDDNVIAHRRMIEVFRSTDTGLTWSGPFTAFHYVTDPDHQKCLSSDKELIGINRATNELLIAYSGTSWRCGDGVSDVITENIGTVPPDGSIDIMLTRSHDGGRTWTAPQSIYKGYAIAAMPVVGPDGTIYVAFAGTAPLGTAPSCPSVLGTVANFLVSEMQLVVASSRDGGKTWTYERRGLCENSVASSVRADNLGRANPSGGVLDPSITVDMTTGRVYVAWPSFAPQPPSLTFGIEFTTSGDSGKTWSPTVHLSPPGGDAVLAAAAADGGVANVVWIATTDEWRTYNAYPVESADGGGTWSVQRVISAATAAGGGDIGDYIWANAHAGRIAVTWTQNRSGDATDVFVRTGSIRPRPPRSHPNSRWLHQPCCPDRWRDRARSRRALAGCAARREMVPEIARRLRRSPLGTEPVEHVAGDLLDLRVAPGEAVGPVGATRRDDRAAARRRVGAEHGVAVRDALDRLRRRGRRTGATR